MQIFLSYAREDEEFATRLANDLKTRGAKIWFDMIDGQLGNEDAWANSVNEALETSNVLLVVLSPTAIEQDYVEADWQYYLDKRRTVIAVVSQRCTLPETLMYRPVVNFAKLGYDNGLHRLQLLLIEESTRRVSSSKWQRRPPNKS